MDLNGLARRYKQMILLFPKRKCKMPRIQGIQELKDLWDFCPCLCFLQNPSCTRGSGKERDLGDQLGVYCECYTCLYQKTREGSETQLQENHAQKVCAVLALKEENHRSQMGVGKSEFLNSLCFCSPASCHWALSKE